MKKVNLIILLCTLFTLSALFLSGGFQDLPVDVQAGRLPVSHFAACPHMVSCASRYLMPSKGKAEAVAREGMLYRKLAN